MIFENTTIEFVELDSTAYKDQFFMTLSNFSRETNFTVDFQVTTYANNTFSSEWDGYFGFAPYTNNRGTNLMKQLKEAGKIDHVTLSLYLGNEHGNSSVLKFGNMDDIGMLPNAEMRTFRTRQLSSWQLVADHMSLDYQTVIPFSDRYLTFNPHVPYVYVPQADWLSFRDVAQKQWSDLTCVGDWGTCFFESSCAQNQKPDSPMQIRLYDVS